VPRILIKDFENTVFRTTLKTLRIRISINALLKVKGEWACLKNHTVYTVYLYLMYRRWIFNVVINNYDHTYVTWSGIGTVLSNYSK